MVELLIDNVPVKVKEGTTILEAARKANIYIPTLCYLKDVNDIGACRVCCVEIEGAGRLVSACNTPVENGMKVITDSARVRNARRVNVELILSRHDTSCTTCVRSGNCQLQKVANDLGLFEARFEEKLPSGKLVEWEKNFPVVRDAAKCINCLRCVQICDKVQQMNVWDVLSTGGRTRVGVKGNRKISETACTSCGQCIKNCPTGALIARDDTVRVGNLLADRDVVKVVQLAPAVYSSWFESLGAGELPMGKLVASLKKCGFDYVFDTTFTADLTIMEEGSEFIERFTKKGDLKKYPMFTSCCPAWVHFIKTEFPALVPQLSSAKSPQAMFGALLKSYFAEKLGKKPEEVKVVSIMPCSAKKAECDLDSLKDKAGNKNVDYSLTVREMMRLIKSFNIDPVSIEPVAIDGAPFGDPTGAGFIFARTAGVMEAALRSAYFLLNKKNPDADSFAYEIKSDEPYVEKVFDMGPAKVRTAVVSGLGNTRRLCNQIMSGEKHFDFVEVMACPSGCVNGGGQPAGENLGVPPARVKCIDKKDSKSKVRFSHENACVQALYKEYLGQPLGEKSEELLHTKHTI